MEHMYFRTSALECIARETLKRLNPNYLNLPPQSLPIEKLIEEVFGLSIEYMRLTENGNELGRMIYDDGYSTRYNPESEDYEFIKVTNGTMLIEALLLENPKLYGRFRFTLAHELAHWILHKSLYTNSRIAAATYITDNCSDDLVEWQANYLAKSILMPVGQVKRGFYQIKAEDSADTEIVSYLAEMFEVSKQAMEIRLNELGLV